MSDHHDEIQRLLKLQQRDLTIVGWVAVAALAAVVIVLGSAWCG